MILNAFLPLLISVSALSPVNSTDKALTESQLKDIFPDANLRTVIKRYIHPDELTISKIKSLDGEFYASGEKITNLEGISYLENIDDFVFWNNNIKELPKEITELKDIDSLNLANNYITEPNVINELKEKGVKVNSDLNFINLEENQYKLDTKHNSINIAVDEKFDLRNVLSKNIDDYYKHWETTDELPKDLNLIVTADNDVVSIDNMMITGKKIGKSKIKVEINKDENSSQIVVINVKVK
ncbi:hypothetical protein [Metaclostridioides mangenotii]|uniref:hypothetical protein n=1 Tax=Metaclostridioides mangenotii TaxID=1540 RepID=UPI00048803E2|nr:hypothetical protein [Clostridioides mangenotii]